VARSGGEAGRTVEASPRYGHGGVLTGLAGYCGRQVARMATAGPYGFPDPREGPSCRSIGERLWLLRQSNPRA